MKIHCFCFCSILFCLLLIPGRSFTQNEIKTDSLIRVIVEGNSLTSADDKGVELIKKANYWEANNYYSEQIKKDEGNKEAYFNRGVINWTLNNPANACRDWSAVLALGDTETFKLLDKNCHGSMVIEDDTIPASRYHVIFSNEKKDNKILSASSGAIKVADVMPEFIGGENALFLYLSKNTKSPDSAKKKGIRGTVFVNFIISKKGSVLFPYIQRGIGGGCDEEALRVIRNMPPWKPGKQNGKPVLVRYSLPVKFT